MNTATKETMPRHIWMHSVITEVGCTVEQAMDTCGRERLNRWYNAGEPVWMAVSGLRQFVEGAKRAARMVDETAQRAVLRSLMEK
jgi:hypothetical protein